EIGRVTSDGFMRVRNDGVTAVEIPAKALAEEAPLYSREAKRATTDYTDHTDFSKEISESSVSSVVQSLRQLLRDPTIASKNWVYRQYDHTVRTGTVVKPGSDAAVFLVRYANKIVAATTDCINFGNPYKPENFWQLREAIEGVAEACRVFGTPVTGGNVSLYNERVAATPSSPGLAQREREESVASTSVVDPTPTIAMVG